MLTDPKLRSQVDALGDKLWTEGFANPLDAIEQFANVVRGLRPCRKSLAISVLFAYTDKWKPDG